MLILTRRVGQKIMIGEGERLITITVKQTRGDGGPVHLGIEAPRDLTIDREEIYQRKLIEKKAVPDE